MAAWFTALKLLPWVEVIRHAPELADGARKLWNTVAKNAPAEAPRHGDSRPLHGPEGAVAQLQARVAALEADAAELHQQMLASSELITALADQNDKLVKAIETNRVRVVWLATATAVLAVVSIVSLALAAGG